MSEHRDHTGRESRSAPGQAAQGSPPPEKTEKTETRNVLTQRVIALNGVLDSSKSGTRPRTVTRMAEEPQPPPKPASTAPDAPVDLSITALEWGVQRAPTPKVEAPEPAPHDAEWATHSSIALELCDDLLISRRVLRANIEDAVTQQYSPALEVSTADLASLDRALSAARALDPDESDLVTRIRAAPAPIQPASPRASRVLVVPAWVAWAVLGLLAVCALFLAYLVMTLV